jgi:RNA polymerase sigma-70 factor (ECF subfamily)
MVPDANLLAAWREGDRKAGNTLLDRHFDALYRFFWNKVDEPDELVQQTLVACVTGRERIHDGDSFRAYMFAVARNRLYTFWEDTKRERARIDFGTVSAVDLGRSPSKVAVARAEHRLLLRALRSIPIDDQMILELHYWESMSGTALAAALGIPEGTVRGRLRRAKRSLQANLRDLQAETGDEDTMSGGLQSWARQLKEYAHRELGCHQGRSDGC